MGLAGLALVRARRRREAEIEPRATVAAGARDAAAAAAIPPTPAPPSWPPTRAWRRRWPASGSRGARATPRASTSRASRPVLGGGRAPAARLTELFERARFSPHPVGEDLREEAIGALETLRIELEAPA